MKYRDVIEDYMVKDHVKRVPQYENTANKPVWYLPHHPVFNAQNRIKYESYLTAQRDRKEHRSMINCWVAQI